MKLTDILNESINLSRYYDEFTKIVHETLDKIIHDDNYQIYTSDDYYKNGKKRQTKQSKFSLDPIKCGQALAKSLKYKCMEIIKSISKSKYVNEFSLHFGHISSAGKCQGLVITIDIEKVLAPIINELNISKDAWGISVNSLVGVITHELVHAIQNLNAWENRKFDNSVASHGDGSKEGYMDYFSHPTEIAAFAHNFASIIIEEHLKTSTPPNLTAIPSIVKSYLRNVFSEEDWKNPKNFKTLKKYYTLVYKEVVDYMEHKEKKKSTPI